MDIPAEWMKELSAQERTVLFLHEALYNLLDYLQSEYVYSKVDVAFVSEKGLVIYSHNNGFEVNQYLVDTDGEQHFTYSPGVENPDNHELLSGATKDDIYKIFRKWEAEEADEYPRTMLSKLEYLGQFDNQTKAYCVAIGYRDSIQNKEVIEYFFTELIKSIRHHINRKYMEHLSRINPIINASQISKEAAIKTLSERFYGNIRDLRGEELYETMCLLSCAPYEQKQNRGRIGILTLSSGKSKAFVKFENPIEICRDNVRIIRKLLELSDRRKTILIAQGGNIVGVHTINDHNGKYAGTGVLFRGNGKWDLFSDKVGSIIAFDSVTVKLANQALDQRVVDGFYYAGIEEYDETAIQNIVKYARKQSHGTTIIVSDDVIAESERLAEANRAIKIIPISVEENTILSLSAIDGAMIINTDGICHAIGAILDGVADKTGNIARGARFNSAITYVDYEAKLGHKVVAIIVSSDDTVDIYPDRTFNRSSLSNG